MKRCWPILLLLVVGQVRVVQPQPPGGTSATQPVKLVPSDGPIPGFASSVDLDGETALVGAALDGVNGPNSGSAYVFERVGGSWVEQAKLVPSDGEENQAFGMRVSLDGDTALIGAPWVPLGTRPPGVAYVFVRTGRTWSEQAKLVPSQGTNNDDFGMSVSVQGDTALIGAYGDNGQAGAAYVYVRQDDLWTQEAKLHARSGWWFGHDVSIDGDTAVIGSPWENEGVHSDVGAGYVFVRSGSTWAQEARLTASELYDFEWLGYSVSFDGTSILLGGPVDAYKGYGPGYAHVFVKKGGSWGEQQRLESSDGKDRDAFGVDASILGRTALVGASGVNSYTGAAYLFVRPSNGTWSEVQKFLPSPDLRGLGWSVALSGDRALISATGAALVYELNPVNLSIAGTCPGPVTATVSNAPPNSEVAVIAAGSNTGWVKPGGACAGTAFEIAEPFQLPPLLVQVDANGNGSGNMTLESNRCWVEALAFESCETSGAVLVP